jgi:alanine racemase
MITYNALTVCIDLAALRANYRLLAGYGPNCWPVVKADAYGHGLSEVARMLAAEGAGTLCVGTATEAAELRESGFGGRIIALMGPLREADYPLVPAHDVVPFVCSVEQLERLGALGVPVRIGLKFETGMGRLGFRVDEADAVLAALAGQPSLEVAVVASHLARADEVEGFAHVALQRERFAGLVGRLRAAGFSFEATLANSGGILAHPTTYFDAQRPGIALYGTNPFAGTPLADPGSGLVEAMTVAAPVWQVRRLAPGDTVSYGSTFTAEREMTAAVVAAGYADGYSRGLTGKGEVLIRGRRAPILGRVCMQMTVVDASHIPDVRAGEEAVLLGRQGDGFISADELAGWWGTITYEVFCLLGLNPREYAG